MTYLIVSETKNGTLKIEGQGYATRDQAKKYIQLFQDRERAMNEVQIKHFDEPLTIEESRAYLIVPRKDITG